MLALMANAVIARIDPARVLPTIRAAASGAAVLRGSRGDAEVAARIILGGVDQDFTTKAIEAGAYNAIVQ